MNLRDRLPGRVGGLRLRELVARLLERRAVRRWPARGTSRGAQALRRRRRRRTRPRARTSAPRRPRAATATAARAPASHGRTLPCGPAVGSRVRRVPSATCSPTTRRTTTRSGSTGTPSTRTCACSSTGCSPTPATAPSPRSTSAGYGELCGGPLARRAEITDKHGPVLERYDHWGVEVDRVEHHPTWTESKADLVRAGFVGLPQHAGRPVPAVRHRVDVLPRLPGRDRDLLRARHDRRAPPTSSSATRPTRCATTSSAASPASTPTRRGRAACSSPSARAAATSARTPRGRCPTATSGASTARSTSAPTSTPRCSSCSRAPTARPTARGGLATFIVPRLLPDGSPNGFHIKRLKPKLGTTRRADRRGDARRRARLAGGRRRPSDATPASPSRVGRPAAAASTG